MLLLLFIFQIFLSLPSITLSDLAADRAALLALRSAVGGRTFLWNAAQQTPCSWAGVQCDNNHVTALHLPGVSLSGELPVGVIGNLTHLRTLSVRFNSLTGQLPADLAACTELRSLYLQGNRFFGPLPDFLFELQDLVRLNVAGNNFTGEISTGFNNLTRLRTLYLENNQFSGTVPDLSNLRPNLAQFNVSFNLLNGSIPKSLQSMPVTSFLGNSLCGRPLKDSCSTSNNTTPAASAGEGISTKKDNGGLSGGAIAGIVIGSVLGFLLLVLLVLVLCRKKRSKKTSSVDVTAIKHNQQMNDVMFGTAEICSHMLMLSF